MNHNLNALIKFGTATHSALSEAWENLYVEYCDISGSTQYKLLKTLKDDHDRLRQKLETIRLSVLILSHRYSVVAVNSLRDKGYNRPFDWEKPDEYRADLQWVLDKSKTLEISVQMKHAEYAKLVSSFDGKPPTMQDWFKLIAYVSEGMNGRDIDIHRMSISEFCGCKDYVDKKHEAERDSIEKMKRRGK